VTRPSRRVLIGLGLALVVAVGLWLWGLVVVAALWQTAETGGGSVTLVGRGTATATARTEKAATVTATVDAGQARPARTPAPAPFGTPTLPPAVDWPTLPDVSTSTPLTTTAHFAVHAADADDPFLTGMARTWAPALEDILRYTSARMGRQLPKTPVHVVFARAYAAACPARGLASPGEKVPLLMIYVDEHTSAIQVRAVLAHEMVHHLTFDGRFVGDGILTEGIAHWGAGQMLLDWQKLGGWDEAVRRYLAAGEYVSIADDTALNPRPGDNCIERRDRVYNIRAAFVDWLIRNFGREVVLAMPYQEHTTVDPDSGEQKVERVPDYAAATGHTLPELERLWLAELRNGRAGDA
jgi:hypothetical protein